MDMGTNLFGEPVLERSAVFVHGDRIELHRKWAPGPKAFIIGHNPSTASGDVDDPTSKWWIDWCRLYGFGSYVAGNLYPFCTSDPRECRRRAAWHLTDDWGARDAMLFVNLPRVVELAKEADQVFVCWGAIATDCDWIEHVVEEIQSGVAPYPDLWCWGKTKDGSPMHPMARGKHRIPKDQPPILWRAA